MLRLTVACAVVTLVAASIESGRKPLTARTMRIVLRIAHRQRSRGWWRGGSGGSSLGGGGTSSWSIVALGHDTISKFITSLSVSSHQHTP